jgi:hypothetical protein
MELLEKGYIHPSSPPWGAPVIFIPRKDGTQQMCVYCHALNEVTIENKHRCLGFMICLINCVVHVILQDQSSIGMGSTEDTRM